MPKASSTKFLDGCHRYGWLINIIVLFLTLAYFLGGLNNRVEALGNRMGNAEQLIYQLLSHSKGSGN